MKALLNVHTDIFLKPIVMHHVASDWILNKALDKFRKLFLTTDTAFNNILVNKIIQLFVLK